MARVLKASSMVDLDVVLATAASTGRAVVVAFTASSCDICCKAVPVFDALEREFTSINFAKVDIDVDPESALVHEIGSLPTLKVFRDGQEVGAMRGANLEGFRQLVEREIAGLPHHPSAADSTARKEQRAQAASKKENSDPAPRQMAQRAALATMMADADAPQRESARVALSTLLKLVQTRCSNTASSTTAASHALQRRVLSSQVSNVLAAPAEVKYRTIKAESKVH